MSIILFQGLEKETLFSYFMTFKGLQVQLHEPLGNGFLIMPALLPSSRTFHEIRQRDILLTQSHL